jgi:hypothetical protein
VENPTRHPNQVFESSLIIATVLAANGMLFIGELPYLLHTLRTLQEDTPELAVLLLSEVIHPLFFSQVIHVIPSARIVFDTHRAYRNRRAQQSP